MRIIPGRLFFLSFSIKTKFGNLQKIRFMSRVLFVCKDNNIVNTYVHSIFTSKAILRTSRKTKYLCYFDYYLRTYHTISTLYFYMTYLRTYVHHCILHTCNQIKTGPHMIFSTQQITSSNFSENIWNIKNIFPILNLQVGHNKTWNYFIDNIYF